MSSFRRAGAVDAGTRPGLHGQTLISMGLVDLDRLLSGGLPLSSVLLVLEDACSGQHLNLMRYFLAEGLACRQRVRWLTAAPPLGGPGAFLPAEASPSQAEEASKEQPELRIAWQYKKYIKDEQSALSTAPYGRSASAGATSTSGSGSSSSASASRAVAAGMGREWCHSYDLTRALGEEGLRGSSLEVLECSGPGPYAEADRRAAEFLSSLSLQTAPGQQPGPGPGTGASVAAGQRSSEGVGRLVIESAGSLAWGGGGSEEQSLLRLLYNVRQRAQQARCAVLVTVPAGLLTPGCAARLPHLADTVLALDCLADDMQLHKLLPDPASAVALLSVRKLCCAGMLGPRLPDGQLYVLRNKRRRLALSPVEVDPDAEDRQSEAAARAAEAYGSGGTGGAAAGGGAGTAGGPGSSVSAAGAGKKSAAAMLCGGPPSSGNRALEF